MTDLEERLVTAALLLHLESGSKPDQTRWREFRAAAEALWNSSVKGVKDAARSS